LRGSAQPPAPVLSVGPATFARWSGFYFGGNVSLGSATSDFSNAARPLVQFSLQHTTLEDQVHPSDFQVLGRGSAVAAGGGAFLGYNTQWQNLVLGVEATYTHTNLNSIRPGTPQRSIIGPHPQRVGTRRGPDKDHSGMWRSVKVDGI
jgi:outer membrane immunogenic protein